ncbi:Uncharacterized protein BP5553_01603 [Venustampulla echinocandica]|uniref:Peptidase C45 hydrolase domain-containing protein n=1 Tax=Venustampulla echinocandica TaxID=2656787 RepID=A0A370U1H6_9HELO|nr:Uncharacterized protein BP5553_01603 [Venustampulla echinocandica]RDL41624.1 Uncharacterized protein BP5553_01603 [Venustampulla echinocandica]
MTIAEQPLLTMEHPFVKTINCQGPPYEIGFTHGSNASNEIHTNIKTYTLFFAESAKITWPEARDRALSQFLPTLEKLYPQILEELKGIADGAGGGLVMADILALNIRSEIALTNYTDGCTSIGQKSPSSGAIYLAQNWDWLEELKNGMVFLHIKPEGSDVEMRFLSEAGIVGKIGLNSYGVGLCMNALRSGASSTEKLPVHFMSRKILQEAHTYEEALLLLEKFGLASTVNYMIADKSGRYGDIECSPLGNTITNPDLGYVAHTNHLCGVGLPPKLQDHPSANSFARLNRMMELTELDIKAHVAPSFESLRARLSDEQGAPYSICRDRPPGAVGMERMTTLSTVIMELTSKTAKVTVGRPCDDLPVIEWSF